MNEHKINVENIIKVYEALGSLSDEVVFVGGATVSLYATHAAAEEGRYTKDVDMVVANRTYSEYAQFEEGLRMRGFCNDTDSKIICRYVLDDLIVDVMTSDGQFFGFQNRWYSEGVSNAVSYILTSKVTIRLFSAPYFIASKLEAFAGRGRNDGRTSADFEDIIYILNNRPEVWEEFTKAPESVRNYLCQTFDMLLQNPYINEWIASHVDYWFAEEQVRNIVTNLRSFIAFVKESFSS